MISTQCDELRAMAESVGMEIPKAATLMMEAADIIDRLDTENDKLREENQSIGLAAYELGRRSMAGENAKLRELAHLVAEYVSADQCEGCVARRACNAGELDMCWIRRAILEKLRELGVEVDS